MNLLWPVLIAAACMLLALRWYPRYIARVFKDGKSPTASISVCPAGRAVRLHLPGMRPDEITGEDFRAALGLIVEAAERQLDLAA